MLLSRIQTGNMKTVYEYLCKPPLVDAKKLHDEIQANFSGLDRVEFEDDGSRVIIVFDIVGTLGSRESAILNDIINDQSRDPKLKEKPDPYLSPFTNEWS